MTVHFIGAGPGDPDLLTIRGRDLIARCPLCLYAGSLVPEAVVAHAPADARVIDTAPLTLDDIIALIADAHAAGHDVARVHSGDPSIYGAIAEQIRRLRDLGIPYDITPGVPAFAAAAAALGTELTVPEVAQTIILRSWRTWRAPRRRSPSTCRSATCARCAGCWSRTTAPTARSPSPTGSAGRTSRSCAAPCPAFRPRCAPPRSPAPR